MPGVPNTPVLRPGRPCRRWLIGAVTFLHALSACDGGTSPDEGLGPPIPCSSGGGTSYTAEDLSGSVRWTRAGSPHTLAESVTVQEMRIEAGASVCAAAGARLAVNHLVAEGTAEHPVLFGALDASSPWVGIRLGTEGRSEIRHAIVERAEIGIHSEGEVLIEDSRIRQTSGPGLQLRLATVRRTTVDTACTRATFCSAVALPGLTYATSPRADVTLEASTVRGSRGDGIGVDSRAGRLVLRNTVIDGSAGVGLGVAFWFNHKPDLVVQQPLTITGGDSYPARVPNYVVPELLPDADAQARLTGNATDELHVGVISGTSAPLTIRKGLTWVVNGQCPAGIGAIHMEPGARLRVGGSDGICPLTTFLIAEGTADEPVLIESTGRAAPLYLRSGPDTSRIRHARVRGVALLVPLHPITIEHVALDSSAVVLGAAGSRISDATFLGSYPLTVNPPFGPLDAVIELTGATSMERVRIRGSALAAVAIAGSGVAIADCDIRDGARAGIVVLQGDATMTGCSFENNAGAGVANRGAATVDARGNWWGDPAGPDGPNGDGVEGTVLYVPFLTTPITPTATVTKPMAPRPQTTSRRTDASGRAA